LQVHVRNIWICDEQSQEAARRPQIWSSLGEGARFALGKRIGVLDKSHLTVQYACFSRKGGGMGSLSFHFSMIALLVAIASHASAQCVCLDQITECPDGDPSLCPCDSSGDTACFEGECIDGECVSPCLCLDQVTECPNGDPSLCPCDNSGDTACSEGECVDGECVSPCLCLDQVTECPNGDQSLCPCDSSGDTACTEGECIDGECVSGPTVTPTLRSPGTATPPHATATPVPPSGPAIILSISGQTLTASLSAAGQRIAGTQNDISFAASAPIAAKTTGKPNCTANADIGLNGTSFAFEPPGCSAGTCTSVRAIAFATDNTNPIPDGSVLYTCVTTGATAGSVFGCTGQVGSNPDGASFNGTSKVCSGDGVSGCTSDSNCTTATTPPTPAPGGLCSVVLPKLGCQGLPASVVPTSTPTTPRATATLPSGAGTPSRTPTATPTRTQTPLGLSAGGSHGCQIGTTGNSGSLWLLVIPIASLMAVRRTRR
jgi:hypothetical protein